MDDTITTIYYLCDEFLKAIGRRDDPQTRLSTAEVMTVPLVAAAFFGGNIDKTRRFLHEYGYMPAMISKSHLNLRIRCCRLYPPEEHGGAFRGYIPSKRRYFYGLRVHLVVTQAGEPVEFSLAAGSEADVSVFSRTWSWTCPKARSSVPIKPTPTTITRTFWRKSACTSKPSARRTPNGRCQRGRSSS